MTVPTFHNIYVYSAMKLWFAYGTAIMLSSITVISGLIAMLKSGASYSANFSTVFRAARGAEVSTEIQIEDLDARDPIKDYVADARVRLGPESSVNRARVKMSRNIPRTGRAHRRVTSAGARLLIGG